MSLLNKDWNVETVKDFTGPRPLLLPDDLAATDAITATNIEYGPTGVQTRAGYVSAFTSTGDMLDARSWYSQDFHRILYLNTSVQVRSYNLVGLSDYQLTSLAAGTEEMAYTQYGSNAYVGGVKNEMVGTIGLPIGTTNPKVVTQDPDNPAVSTADDLWPPPPSLAYFTGFGVTPGGGSNITTAGVHRLYIVITTRSGYKTRPINTGFQWTSDGQIYSVAITINPGVPSQYLYAQLAFSLADQPTVYYLPNESFTGIGPARMYLNNPGTYFIPFGITDAVLALGTSGADLSQNFEQGTPFNFQPYIIQPYQQRMVYIGRIPKTEQTPNSTESAAFISDPGLPQNVRLADSTLQLPTRQDISAAAVLRGSLYLLGPGYTYQAQDSGDVPAAWPVPQLVDGAIGASRPDAVGVDLANGTMWVADEDGLYFFDGAMYARTPVSYYQGEWWNRINWKAPQGAIRVVVAPEKQCVMIFAPLDANTVPTVALVWDWQNGFNIKNMRFSVHEFSSAGQPSGRYLDPHSGRYRVFRGTGTTFLVMRLPTDPVFTDGATPYTVTYEHAMLPIERIVPKRFHCVRARMQATSTVNWYVLNYNGTKVDTLGPQSAIPNPQNAVKRFCTIQSEGMRVRFTTTGYWKLTRLELWWEPWLEAR